MTSSALLIRSSDHVVEQVYLRQTFPGDAFDGYYVADVEGEPPPCGSVHDPESDTFTTPAIPEMPVRMPAISDRQFGEGLWHDGLISYDDYLAFIGPGTIPPRLKAIIDQLPDDDTGQPTPRKVATGMVTGAKDYAFDNPLVETIRAAFASEDPAWTVEHLRERWSAWAAL